MHSEVKVVNKENTEFNFTWVRPKTKFKLIVINCVYDNFSDSFDWMDDYNQDDTLIIFWHAGNIDWSQSWLERLNKKARTKNFVYLTWDPIPNNLNKTFNIEFNIKYFTGYDIKTANNFDNSALDINIHKYKHFSYLNKKDTIQNRYVLSRLEQNKLLDNGSISYPILDKVDNILNKNVGFTDAAFDYIKSQLKNISAYPAYDEELRRDKHYHSYVNIISEVENSITENTFNAVASNQIFFVLGAQHSLELLKSLGYKTFSPVIDESYDNLELEQERLFAVTREAIRFLNRPEEQISNDYKKVIPIIEHNRDLLFRQTLKYKWQKFFDENFI